MGSDFLLCGLFLRWFAFCSEKFKTSDCRDYICIFVTCRNRVCTGKNEIQKSRPIKQKGYFQNRKQPFLHSVIESYYFFKVIHITQSLSVAPYSSFDFSSFMTVYFVYCWDLYFLVLFPKSFSRLRYKVYFSWYPQRYLSW